MIHLVHSMVKIIECVPNFSEGRDKNKINTIVACMTAISGIALLDQESDPDHNRSVITIVGEPESVMSAVFEGIKMATELIDLKIHRGEHPRIGATDVVPFIPISGSTMDECIDLAKRLGAKVAQELKIPVYLYESAATRPDRVNLADVRKGQFEGIRDEIKTNPDRKPDFGPSEVHPSAGAIAIGARMILIAYNVNLLSPDLTYSKEISKAIRIKDGGFHNVKALGYDIKARNMTKVWMNMVNYIGSPLHRAFELVYTVGLRLGITTAGSEIVGLTPLSALTHTVEHYLRVPAIYEEKISWDNDYHMQLTFRVGNFTPMLGTYVAQALSESSGGYKGVIATVTTSQAIEVDIADAKQTSLYRIFNTALNEIEHFGTTITSTTFRSIPVQVLVLCAEFYLRLENFKIDQVLEVRLREKQMQEKK